MNYEREKEFSVNYKGIILKHKFYADFVIDNKIILEIKSSTGFVDEYYAQVLNYLTISKLQIGLLINFNEKSLQYKRIIQSK
ncbi:GxxExxY protein [Pedobacter chinensis]|uniref:GxxExxY protein n=1 Tax=Pedobacter chinensis TaxID=2282421 RepID=UPI003744B007